MRAATVDRARLASLMRDEEERFVRSHPRSRERAERAARHLVAGVPMPWMRRWPGAFPLSLERASGARFTCADGIEYVDLCLGDTGAMTGHAVPEISAAVAAQMSRGSTVMLPTEDAAWAGAELARRFGLPKWQFTLSATDANRFVLRFARAVTGRAKIVVHDWCYHGTVDETLVVLDERGRTVARPGAIGPQVDPGTTTRAVPFNDLPAMARALAEGDVACILMEPALTNIGIVLPEPGYLAGVRDLARRHGVLLVIDETHTICAGPGGCTAAWGLEPDAVVIGKTIGGGIPVGTYGFSAALAERVERLHDDGIDVSGVGGTLAGNALAMAAIRATLGHALLPEQFARTTALAEAWTRGVRDAYEARGLEWCVQRLGSRAEYWFCAPPRDGAAAAAAVDHELDAFMHLWAINRGILLTPFHNMALFSAFHDERDVAAHDAVFEGAVAALVG
ncbi:MAG: transaminase [Ilumatobacteraceae bacterium]|mgnify:CR=1 FL=1